MFYKEAYLAVKGEFADWCDASRCVFAKIDEKNLVELFFDVDPPKPMIMGFLRPSMSMLQVIVSLTIPAIALILLFLWLLAKRKATKLNTAHRQNVAEGYFQSMVKKQSVWNSEKNLLNSESRPNSVRIERDRAGSVHGNEAKSTWKFNRRRSTSGPTSSEELRT